MSYMGMSKSKAIIYALLAAAFYAVNVPVSKLLLSQVGPTMMAALLYLGAGIGMAVLSLADKGEKGDRLDRNDLPYVIGMIVLDIAAPVFLRIFNIREKNKGKKRGGRCYGFYHDFLSPFFGRGSGAYNGCYEGL